MASSNTAGLQYQSELKLVTSEVAISQVAISDHNIAIATHSER